MLQIFTLHDLQTKTHGKPMFYSNEEHAKQEILKFFLLADPKLELDPKNYEINHHGQFNELTGEMIAMPLAKIITNCEKIVKKEENKILEYIREYELLKEELKKEIVILKTEKDLLVNNQLEKEKAK